MCSLCKGRQIVDLMCAQYCGDASDMSLLFAQYPKWEHSFLLCTQSMLTTVGSALATFVVLLYTHQHRRGLGGYHWAIACSFL